MKDSPKIREVFIVYQESTSFLAFPASMKYIHQTDGSENAIAMPCECAGYKRISEWVQKCVPRKF